MALPRPRAVETLPALAVFAAAFLYRFNTLGGALGGFTNDEFGYLARARQIQSGALPFRDFNDPGWFLTDYAAAAAQWIGGYNLRSEALLTVGMLALGAAITFVLARRIAGPIAAVIGVVLQVALEPRHYNYPKIVLYAAGIACAWAYVDRPGRARLMTLGAVVALGFLFRHDHLVYLGALGLMTIALVHRASVREGLRAAALLGLIVAVCLAPFLVFVSAAGGVGEYFRAALVYVRRDAARTSFAFPRASFDLSTPLVAWARSSAPVDINVRWKPLEDAERQSLESRYHLANASAQGGTTWRYQLQDPSVPTIEALVRDPLVEDTQGIDRSTFRPEGRPLRLQSQFDHLENATAYLYYVLLIQPLLAALVLWRVARAGAPARVVTGPSYLLPVIGLAALLNVGFLSRGSTNIRIGDVGVTAALLTAWLIAAVAGPDGRRIAAHPATRMAVRAAAVAMLVFAFLSTNGLSQSWRHLQEAYGGSGSASALARTGEAWRELGVDPAAFSRDPRQPRLLRIASYVSTCTAPADRLLALGMYPELYYFANRQFAGGHAWLLPLYYSDDRDEALLVARVRAARVPIVITEASSEYREQYQPVFEQLDAYLRMHYRDAGEVEIDGGRMLRVLVRQDLASARRYEPLGLPCFANGLSVAS